MSMIKQDREIELKFSVPTKRLKELGSFLELPKRKKVLRVLDERQIEQRDTYFDSENFDLARHGCALRVRKTVERGSILTFKRFGSISTGACTDRLEIEGLYILGTLERITSLVPWLLLLDKPGQGEISDDMSHALLRRLGLRPVLDLMTERTIQTIEFRKSMICKLCVDRVHGRNRKKNLEFRELECEYVSGDIDKLEDLDRYLRKQMPWLKASCRSKYEHALRVFRLWEYSKAIRDQEVAKWEKRLNKVFEKFNRQYARAIKFKDEEDLHGCRVALRQLITMFGFLGDAEYTAAPLTELTRRFRKIQKILGRLRDRDVYYIFATVEPALQLKEEQLESEFLDIILLERDRERQRALSRLPKYYNKSLQEEWKKLLSKHLRKLVRATHVEQSYVLLISRFREAHEALVQSRAHLGPAHPQTVKQLHRTRILGKNLRYASQYLSFTLPGNTKSLVAGFTDLQDQLGDINDISNHIAHTRSLATEFETLLGGALQPRIAALEDELTERLQQLEIGDLLGGLDQFIAKENAERAIRIDDQ